MITAADYSIENGTGNIGIDGDIDGIGHQIPDPNKGRKFQCSAQSLNTKGINQNRTSNGNHQRIL